MEHNDEEHSGEEHIAHENDYFNSNSDGNGLESITVNLENNVNYDYFSSESNEFNSDEYDSADNVTLQKSTENYNESDNLTNKIFDYNVQTNDESSTNSINNHNQGDTFDYSVLDDKKYDSESGESGLQDLIHSFLKYFKENRSDWYKKWKFPL